jgi:cobalt/nickel transport protein
MRPDMTAFQKRLWIGLIVMALLTPLGIYLPKIAGSDEAWGEWGTGAIEKMLGYVPEGMKKITDIWKAPVPDYNSGGEGVSSGIQAAWYVISALIGVAAVVLVIYVITRILSRHEK